MDKDLVLVNKQMIKKRTHKHNLVGWLFILPAIVGFASFMIYPLFYSLYMSFMDWDMFNRETSVFIGFDNYLAAFNNRYFIAAITNNFKFAVFAVPALIVISLFLAALLNRNIFARGTIRMMFFMPYVTTITATAVVFSAMFHPVKGPVNEFLRMLSVSNPPGWATSSQWALFTIALFWIWKMSGYCIVIFLAGLQGVPQSLYEAADIDGANGRQKFFKITVPLLSPTTFFLTITCAIHSFQIFAEVQILTQGGPGTASLTTVMHIYEAGFINYEMGYASAVSWIFFLIILVITMIQWLAQKKWVEYV